MKYRSKAILVMLMLTGTVFAQVSDLQIHGFISQGYMKSSDNNFLGRTAEGTFEFNEVGINFSTELTDNLRVGMQFFARDLGNLGNDNIVVDWAYGDYRFYDWFGIRGGKMKMPLGLYNEIRDIDMLRTGILLPQGVYNESWRDTFNALKGIGIYGTTEVGPLGTISYQGQVGVLNVDPETGLNKYLEDQLWAHMSEYKLSTSYVANLSWDTPISGLKLASSIFLSDMSVSGVTEDSEFWRKQTINVVGDVLASFGLDRPGSYEEALLIAANFGVDADLVNLPITQELKDNRGLWLSGEYTYEDLKLAAEYFTMYTEATTSSPELGVLRSFKNDLGGFYGSVGYRFTDWLEAASYYSEYYTDFSDKNGKGYAAVYGLPASNSYLKDLDLSLRFDVNSNWIVKVEGHKMNGTAVMFRQDQDDPKNVKKDWLLFAGKLTYNF